MSAFRRSSLIISLVLLSGVGACGTSLASPGSVDRDRAQQVSSVTHGPDAESAAHRGRRGKSWVLRFDDSSAIGLGPLNLVQAGPRRVRKWVGRPTSTESSKGGTACVARWAKVGLKVVFVARADPARGACAPTARISQVVVKGRRARGRLRTASGLKVGDSVRQIKRKYKSAHRKSKRAWWLRSAFSPVLGKRFGIVVALVAGGHIVGFVARADGVAAGVSELEGGVWQGPVSGDSTAYNVTMALRPGDAVPGQRVGSTDYPELHCGGALVFASRSFTELEVVETILYGKDRCVDTGIVSVRAFPWGGGWSYEGTSSDASGRTPTAALSHQSLPVDISDRIDPMEAGEWTGAVRGDSSQYEVEMDLGSAAPALPGQVQGTQNYPKLACGGTLTYVGRTYTTLVLQEDITFGQSNCINSGEVTFRAASGQWNYQGTRLLDASLVRK